MINEEIIRYIDNEMSDEEKTNFEQKLNNNSSFNEEYESYLSAKRLGKVFLEDEILGYIKKHETQAIKINQKKSNSKIINIGLAIAAILILGYFAINFFNGNASEINDNSQFAMAYVEPPVLPIERGSGNDLQKAIVLKQQNQLDKAIDLLLNADSITIEMKYWTAELMIEAKKGKEARPILEELVTIEYELPRTQYLMAMSYLADENLSEAKAYISKVGIENFEGEEKLKLEALMR